MPKAAKVLAWEVYLRSLTQLLASPDETENDITASAVDDDIFHLLCKDRPKWLNQFHTSGALQGVKDTEITKFVLHPEALNPQAGTQFVHRYKNGLLLCGLSNSHIIFKEQYLVNRIEFVDWLADFEPVRGSKAQRHIQSTDTICVVHAMDRESQSVSVPIYAGLRGLVCEVNKNVAISPNEDSCWFVILAPPKGMKKLANVDQLAHPFSIESVEGIG